MEIKLKSSANPLLYKMYKDLNGISFIPTLIKSEDGYDTFKINGRVGRSKPLNKEELTALAIMIKFIQNASRFKLGGECYLNNRLTMDNIIINENGTPVQILDWSMVSRGNGIEDLIMLIDELVDLLEERYSNKEALNRIIGMGQFYNSCHKPLELGDKMKLYYENKIVTSELCCMEEEAMRKLDFVEKYRRELNEI